MKNFEAQERLASQESCLTEGQKTIQDLTDTISRVKEEQEALVGDLEAQTQRLQLTIEQKDIKNDKIEADLKEQIAVAEEMTKKILDLNKIVEDKSNDVAHFRELSAKTDAELTQRNFQICELSEKLNLVVEEMTLIQSQKSLNSEEGVLNPIKNLTRKKSRNVTAPKFFVKNFRRK